MFQLNFENILLLQCIPSGVDVDVDKKVGIFSQIVKKKNFIY